MRIERRSVTHTPFGSQETLVTDIGHFEIWNKGDGYQWRFTSMERFPTTDGKKYHNSGAALEAAKAYLGV